MQLEGPDTHNIYACEKCEYKSNSLQGLNSHAKVHKQKSLKCSKCDFTFNSMHKLTNHMEIHTRDVIISEKSPQSSNISKRSLSISLEVVDPNKKTKKPNSKKSRNNC